VGNCHSKLPVQNDRIVPYKVFLPIVHISIDICNFIRQTNHFILCKCSVTDTTLMKMADLWSELSDGVLKNFRWDLLYSISIRDF